MGAFLSRLTGRPPFLSGVRMLTIAAAAAAVTYLVGTLLDVTVVG